MYNLGFKMKMVDKPMVVWDFVSLKILMDTAYAFMVSDDAAPLRICKHCGNVFTASHVKTEFCSPSAEISTMFIRAGESRLQINEILIDIGCIIWYNCATE